MKNRLDAGRFFGILYLNAIFGVNRYFSQEKNTFFNRMRSFSFVVRSN